MTDLMTQQEIRQLYAMVMSYDNRKLSEANLRAWWEQSHRNRWTLHEAIEAVQQHHAESSAFLMPAHVTELIRAKRRVPPEHKPLELERPPAQPETVKSIMSELRRRMGWKQRVERDDPALQVRCPWCKAAIGRPCSQRLTTGSHKGEYKHLAQPHPSRVDLAQEAS